MRNKILWQAALSLFLCCLPQTSLPQQLAFPGAEGAGKHTVGGRGGKVIKVTNLNDGGPGSLRAAIEAKGARTIVFEVSGIIALNSALEIENGYCTIAGQTAPGGGICLKNYSLITKADQIIIRYIRSRFGDEGKDDDDAIKGGRGSHIIIDHCSASWSVDESLSFYNIDSLTVQWCIVSESLDHSHHAKGPHGYGGIWGGRNASFHHNLIASHSSRSPRFSGSSTTPACVNVDFRNNVIYNWGFNSSYGGEKGTINMASNYYKAGPATLKDIRNRIVDPWDSLGSWHIDKNFVYGFPEISVDNWAGGVQGKFASKVIKTDKPFPYVPIEEQTAEEAYELVLQNAGANFPARDAVDKRIVDEVITGIAHYEGKGYKKEYSKELVDSAHPCGIIDSQKDVDGWPSYKSAPPPPDKDNDGMADDWEKVHGLNSSDPSDANAIGNEGYTNLENYINSLVK